MRYFVLSMFLSAGVLCLPSTSSADPPHQMGGGSMGKMMGSGAGSCGSGPMMEGGSGGCGMMEHGGMGMGLEQFSKLNLNPDQRAKLNRIKLDLQKQHWSLKGKTFDHQANLQDLWNADRPDPKKIGAVYGQLFDIRRQMIESSVDAMNKARDLLTKDQVDQLKQMRQGGNPGDCPMHEQMHQHEMKGQ